MNVLAVGPSDAGGAQTGLGLLDVLPILVSVGALVISTINLITSRRKVKEDTLWSFLEVLTGRDVGQWREVVVEAGRVSIPPVTMADLPPLSAAQAERVPEIRAAVRSLAAVVQLAPSVFKRAGVYLGRPPVGTEPVLTQLSMLVSDLNDCTSVWAPYLGTDGDLEIANASLVTIHKMSREQPKKSGLEVLHAPLHIATRFDAVKKRERAADGWRTIGGSEGGVDG